jgi:hypothetical protein
MWTITALRSPLLVSATVLSMTAAACAEDLDITTTAAPETSYWVWFLTVALGMAIVYSVVQWLNSTATTRRVKRSSEAWEKTEKVIAPRVQTAARLPVREAKVSAEPDAPAPAKVTTAKAAASAKPAKTGADAVLSTRRAAAASAKTANKIRPAVAVGNGAFGRRTA